MWTSKHLSCKTFGLKNLDTWPTGCFSPYSLLIPGLCYFYFFCTLSQLKSCWTWGWGRECSCWVPSFLFIFSTHWNLHALGYLVHFYWEALRGPSHRHCRSCVPLALGQSVSTVSVFPVCQSTWRWNLCVNPLFNQISAMVSDLHRLIKEFLSEYAQAWRKE